MEISGTNVSGVFPLAPTESVVTETEILPGYQVTVSYSITPAENYAGPPGVTPLPPES
ncbi:MAG TPA: hypothetical protein VKK31_00090 [Thermoanaerobaculia bacterium]|nr:hypothetical protein [Thermoanaerobaculia bacterium]